MKKIQRGMGMMEILVALLILAIAILGFTALQLRAVAASMEAGNNVQATNIARDLTERIRINRSGLSTYVTSASTHKDVKEIPTTCEKAGCTAAALANYDIDMVRYHATNANMKVAVLKCAGITLERMCVYVAWDDTTPTQGSGAPHCTNDTSYVANAKCVMVEAYTYGTEEE